MKISWLLSPVAVLWAASLSAQSTGDPFSPTPLRQTHASPPGFVFDGTVIDAIEFFTPHERGNGRSCATCHRPEDNFGLTPATVEARYQLLLKRRQKNPAADDPLFRSIDADDFDQDFTTLRTKALVRVALPLAHNVKLADDPTATSVLVWRAVPTVVNAGLTAPYQAEGRLGTLADQALAAMREHSEITQDPDDRVRAADSALPGTSVLVESRQTPGSRARRRGGAAERRTTLEPSSSDREKRRSRNSVGPATAARHRQSTRTHDSFPYPSAVRCRVRRPSSTSSCRRRGYLPARRRPRSSQGLPTASLEERTYLVTVPNNTLTIVTSDPGRGAITGDAREFGRFDVPALFGVARTAPYFHDNSAATLDDVVRHYQALFELLTFFANNNLFAPPVNGQGCNAGECGIRPLPDDEVVGLLVDGGAKSSARGSRPGDSTGR